MVELDLKSRLEGTTSVDTSNLASKSDLASLKVEVDEKDIDKLKTAPANLSKPSIVVDNNVVKKLCMINYH